jgi:HAD superfamily phosphoserine phosphatase-like hydrolase
MKYKEYSQELWSLLNKTIDQIKSSDPEPIAAFDADGTLWDTDLGETFFHHQIDNNLVELPTNAWNFYHDMKAIDPRKAYLWLAQICKGQKLTQVRTWADQAISTASPIPVFSDQQKLIELFLSKGIKIYIITASVKWAVEPGARMLGLTNENVIGIETTVENDIITDNQKGIITYRQGKVDALLEKTRGKKPFFASGNTMGDFQLLQSASHLSLAVSAAQVSTELYKTESELYEQAQKYGWASHRFI